MTSVLDLLEPAICNEVTGGVDAERILARRSRPTISSWCGSAAAPTATTSCSATCSGPSSRPATPPSRRWCRVGRRRSASGEGEVRSAITHHLAAGNEVRALHLIGTLAWNQHDQGDPHPLREWRRRLLVPAVGRDPWRLIERARIALLAGDVDAASADLDAGERLDEPDRQAGRVRPSTAPSTPLRASIHELLGDPEAVLEEAALARRELGRADARWAPDGLAGAISLAHLLLGETDRAWKAAEDWPIIAGAALVDGEGGPPECDRPCRLRARRPGGRRRSGRRGAWRPATVWRSGPSTPPASAPAWPRPVCSSSTTPSPGPPQPSKDSPTPPLDPGGGPTRCSPDSSWPGAVRHSSVPTPACSRSIGHRAVGDMRPLSRTLGWRIDAAEARIHIDDGTPRHGRRARGQPAGRRGQDDPRGPPRACPGRPAGGDCPGRPGPAVPALPEDGARGRHWSRSEPIRFASRRGGRRPAPAGSRRTDTPHLPRVYADEGPVMLALLAQLDDPVALALVDEVRGNTSVTERLSDRELRVLEYLPTRLDQPADRLRALHLAQHDQVPHQGDLPEARCVDQRRGRSPGGGRRPPAAAAGLGRAGVS